MDRNSWREMKKEYRLWTRREKEKRRERPASLQPPIRFQFTNATTDMADIEAFASGNGVNYLPLAAFTAVGPLQVAVGQPQSYPEHRAFDELHVKVLVRHTPEGGTPRDIGPFYLRPDGDELEIVELTLERNFPEDELLVTLGAYDILYQGDEEEWIAADDDPTRRRKGQRKKESKDVTGVRTKGRNATNDSGTLNFYWAKKDEKPKTPNRSVPLDARETAPEKETGDRKDMKHGWVEWVSDDTQCVKLVAKGDAAIASMEGKVTNQGKLTASGEDDAENELKKDKCA